MAAMTVMSSMASVLAVSRSMPSNTQLAIIRPASTAARRETRASAVQ